MLDIYNMNTINIKIPIELLPVFLRNYQGHINLEIINGEEEIEIKPQMKIKPQMETTNEQNGEEMELKKKKTKETKPQDKVFVSNDELYPQTFWNR